MYEPVKQQLELVVANSVYIHRRGKDFDIRDKIPAKKKRYFRMLLLSIRALTFPYS